jgi:beta-mannosidase
LLTQDSNANAEPYQLKKSFQLCAANETIEKKNLTVVWEIRDTNAKILREGSKNISVDALSSKWLDKIDVPDFAINDQYISYRLFDGKEKASSEAVSEGTVILSLPKFFHWQNPKLEFSVDDDIITIKASSYAKSVEIHNADQDLILSDNYFDMNAGEKKVKIISGKAKGIKLRSVFNIK